MKTKEGRKHVVLLEEPVCTREVFAKAPLAPGSVIVQLGFTTFKAKESMRKCPSSTRNQERIFIAGDTVSIPSIQRCARLQDLDPAAPLWFLVQKARSCRSVPGSQKAQLWKRSWGELSRFLEHSTAEEVTRSFEASEVGMVKPSPKKVNSAREALVSPSLSALLVTCYLVNLCPMGSSDPAASELWIQREFFSENGNANRNAGNSNRNSTGNVGNSTGNVGNSTGNFWNSNGSVGNRCDANNDDNGSSDSSSDDDDDDDDGSNDSGSCSCSGSGSGKEGLADHSPKSTVWPSLQIPMPVIVNRVKIEPGSCPGESADRPSEFVGHQQTLSDDHCKKDPNYNRHHHHHHHHHRHQSQSQQSRRRSHNNQQPQIIAQDTPTQTYLYPPPQKSNCYQQQQQQHQGIFTSTVSTPTMFSALPTIAPPQPVVAATTASTAAMMAGPPTVISQNDDVKSYFAHCPPLPSIKASPVLLPPSVVPSTCSIPSMIPSIVSSTSTPLSAVPIALPSFAHCYNHQQQQQQQQIQEQKQSQYQQIVQQASTHTDLLPPIRYPLSTIVHNIQNNTNNGNSNINSSINNNNNNINSINHNDSIVNDIAINGENNGRNDKDQCYCHHFRRCNEAGEEGEVVVGGAPSCSDNDNDDNNSIGYSNVGNSETINANHFGDDVIDDVSNCNEFVNFFDEYNDGCSSSSGSRCDELGWHK